MPIRYLGISFSPYFPSKIIIGVFWMGIMAVFLPFSQADAQTTQHMPAQSDTLRLTLTGAISMADRQNELVKRDRYQVKADREQEKTAFDPGATTLSFNHEEFNGNTSGKKGFQISQNIPFPLKTIRKSHLLHQQTGASSEQVRVTKNALNRQVKLAWFHLIYLEKKAGLFTKLNHTYRNLSKVARLKYKTGETSYLNKVTAQTRQQEVANQLNQTKSDIDIAQKELQKWLNTSKTIIPDTSSSFLDHQHVSVNQLSPSGNPRLNLARKHIATRKAAVSFRQAQYFPDLNLAFGPQSLDGQSGFYTFTIGVQFPLWFKPEKARIQSAKYQVRKAEAEYNFINSSLSKDIQKAKSEVRKDRANITFYQQKALKQAKELTQTAHKSYQTGEIDYTEFLLDIHQAAKIRLAYLDAINQYNQARIHLEYLLGK